MRGSYDNVAWFYDGLTRLVYGKAVIRAQQYLIAAIPAGATVLIAGGGTGWILEELAKIHPQGLKITYVELSVKMLAIAKKKNAGNNEVTFINSSIETVALAETYDVVLTPFLFDNFSEQMVSGTFSHINGRVKEDGLWLFADFRVMDNKKIWQKIMLKTMYVLFGFLCHIEASRMPETEKYFSAYRYRLAGEKEFFKKFIISKIFRKGGS